MINSSCYFGRNDASGDVDVVITPHALAGFGVDDVVAAMAWMTGRVDVEMDSGETTKRG